MRRMMHAVALMLMIAPAVHAQTQLRPLPPPPSDEGAFLADESRSEGSIDLEDSQALRVSTSPAENPKTVHAPKYDVMHNAAELMQIGSDRPYSQLAAFMNCSDASPNLWAGYGCERARIAACINQHVDNQCHCSNKSRCLHAHASSPCGNDANCGPKFGGHGRVNRYKQPFASLHASPSDSCGSQCATGDCASPSGCGDTGCTSCQQAHGGSSTFPASAKRPSPILMANPSRSRLVNPEGLFPKASLPVADSNPRFETRR